MAPSSAPGAADTARDFFVTALRFLTSAAAAPPPPPPRGLRFLLWEDGDAFIGLTMLGWLLSTEDRQTKEGDRLYVTTEITHRGGRRRATGPQTQRTGRRLSANKRRKKHNNKKFASKNHFGCPIHGHRLDARVTDSRRGGAFAPC